MANTLEQQKLQATIQANADRNKLQQDILNFNKGEPGRRINEKFIDFFLNRLGNPFGVPLGSSSSSNSGGLGGHKRDPGLDNRIQKEIDYYYSLAKDIDSLSTYIAKLRNTSNDSEFNKWFAAMPEERQGEFLRFSALSGKRLGEKIDYAKLADSLEKQLDNKHSQAQAVYENTIRYIDNINEALDWPVYNKPVNLFPDRHPDAIKAAKVKDEQAAQAAQAAYKAKIMAEMEEAEKRRKEIERIAFGSNDNNLSGSSQGKSGAPAKAEYDTSMWPNLGTKPISLGIGAPIDPSYFNGGNNVYEQYLRALNAGKNR